MVNKIPEKEQREEKAALFGESPKGFLFLGNWQNIDTRCIDSLCFKGLFCASHTSRSFACTDSFSLNNNPVRQAYLLCLWRANLHPER